jgi:predicted nucleic acid-binding protein
VSPDAILALAASVYDGLSPQDITDVEQIALQREDFFGDADILIAATRIEHGLVIVTNNESHYNRITDIELENWLA